MAEMVPIIAIMSVFGSGVIIVAVIMFFVHRQRQLLHEERLKAIEKGLPVPASEETCPPSLSHEDYRARALHRAVMLLSIGAGLTFALYFTAGWPVAVWGIFVGSIGLGNLIYWLIVRHSGGATE